MISLIFEELSAQIEERISSKQSGIFNCCSGKPKSLRTAVEEFIAVHNLKIKPKYNVFPARPYDSMAVWGKKQVEIYEGKIFLY